MQSRPANTRMLIPNLATTKSAEIPVVPIRSSRLDNPYQKLSGHISNGYEAPLLRISMEKP